MKLLPPAFSAKQIALWAIQAVLVIGLSWVAFRNVEIEGLGRAMSRADWNLLLASVIPLVVERIVRPYRLAKLLGGSMPLPDVIAAQSVSQLVNLVLPLRAGELFLALILRGATKTSASQNLLIVLIDRLLDVAMVLIIFSITLAMVANVPAVAGTAALVLTIGFFVCIAAMIVMPVAKRRILHFVHRRIEVFSTDRADLWTGRLENIIDACGVLRDRQRMSVAVAATVVTWLLGTFSCWIVLIAVAPGTPIAAAAFALSLGVIGITIVTTPAGVGIVHAAYVLGVMSFGVDLEAGAAFAILFHFISTSVTAAMGVIGLPIVKHAGLTIWGRTS